MKNKGTVRLETERLILRKFTIDDIEDSFRNWTNDERVTRFLRWMPHKDVAVTRKVICSWISEYEKDDFYQWAIVEKKSGMVVGVISSVGSNEKLESIHIGYALGYEWWNKGYVTEALHEVIRFFFEEVGANRIESQHDPENIGSGKVMLKCGMKYEGTLRDADWSNRGIVDAATYSILRREYLHK